MAQTINILALKAGTKRSGQICCAGQFAGSPLANSHLARLALEIRVEGKHPAQGGRGKLRLLRDARDIGGLMICLSRDRFPEQDEALPFASVGFAVASLSSHGMAHLTKTTDEGPIRPSGRSIILPFVSN